MNNLLCVGLIFSTLIFSGCAGQLHNIKSASEVRRNEGHGVVFGRLEVEAPKFKEAYTLAFRNVSTSQSFSYSMRSWGCRNKKGCNSQPFCFYLPPGEYEIFRMNIYQGATISEVLPKYKFFVNPSSTTYIGTLYVGQERIEHNYLLWAKGKINLQIRDDHDKDQAGLADTCPGVKNSDYEISLMAKPEESVVKETKK